MTVAERTGPPAGADPETGSRVDAGRRRPAKTKDRSRLARRRVAVRLAYRQVRRTWASSLLIVLLIALPIAGMAGVAVFVDSSTATPEDRLTVQLGQMEAWVQPMGVPDAGFWQAPDDPWWNGYPITADGSWQEPEGEPLDDPTEALPAGTETVALSEGNARIETASGIGAVWGWGGAAWDERFTGRFEMLDGRAPQSGDEVLVTPATLDRAGTAIGGTITDADSGEAFTVTGTVDVATLADSESGVVFFDSDRFGQPRWYLPEWAPTWTEIQQLNDQGVAVYAREVVLDPPPFEVDGMQMGTYDPRASMMLALASGLGVGGAFAAYMVIMLAGAAFAVSARRQQRALAIAASVGADARDLRRTIRLQGTVLGAVGGVLGVAAGIGLAALVMQVTANGAATQFWGFHVPWLVLAGVLVFAVLVGTASAVMPARTVAKTDAISALRGARRPQKVQASRPLWGSLMILVGIALTIVSGVLAAAVAGNNEIPYDSPLRWLPFVGIVAGPVLAQLGIVLSGRWLLWLASRVLSRVGIAARIASRDAVANGSRTVPAFAAIGATVFVGVFAMGLGSMITAQTARNWTYGAPVGTAWVTSYSTAQDGTALNATDAADAAASADRALSEAGATATARVLRQVENWGLENEAEVPADSSRAVAVTPERELLDPEVDGYGSMSELDNPRNNIIVLAADDIETVTASSSGQSSWTLIGTGPHWSPGRNWSLTAGSRWRRGPSDSGCSAGPPTTSSIPGRMPRSKTRSGLRRSTRSSSTPRSRQFTSPSRLPQRGIWAFRRSRGPCSARSPSRRRPSRPTVCTRSRNPAAPPRTASARPSRTDPAGPKHGLFRSCSASAGLCWARAPSPSGLHGSSVALTMRRCRRSAAPRRCAAASGFGRDSSLPDSGRSRVRPPASCPRWDSHCSRRPTHGARSRWLTSRGCRWSSSPSGCRC